MLIKLVLEVHAAFQDATLPRFIRVGKMAKKLGLLPAALLELLPAAAGAGIVATGFRLRAK